MKILVTGGTGFIGSHTVVELLNQNHEVVIVDNLFNSKEYVLERIKRITNKMPIFYKCDLCDIETMDSIFKKEKIECVIHFGALKSGADSIKNPGLYYHNNIDSTHVMVLLMEKYGVDKMIFSSSATVYGNSKNVPITEEEQIGDVISPYGMSKYLDELYLKHRATSTKKYKVVVFRYFNPIGAHPSGLIGEDSPDDVPNNLMLYMLKVALGELPYLRVFGDDYNTPDGSGVRDYIHVVDLALGHVAAINYFPIMSNQFEVFNLGTGHGFTVYELVNAFEKVNGIKIPCKIAPRRPGDVEISYACVDKANKLLGWKTKFTKEECVRDAWKFIKNENNKI